MKLDEIKQLKGTYAALRVLDPSNSAIFAYIKANNLPHKTHSKEERKHVTLIYSRVYCPDMVADKERVHLTKPQSLEVFPTQDGKRALVILLSAPTVMARHRELMSLHPATYDYPQYKAHITLSYDIGDLDISTLPPFTDEILLGMEYVEDLKLDWQNS